MPFGHSPDEARLSTVPQPLSRTTPRSPSTVTSMPSRIRRVAPRAPTTHGIPYSRAVMAVCARTPPASVTTALARAKSTVHGGEVVRQTRTSPGISLSASDRSRMILAGPVTTPRLAAIPRTSASAASPAPSGWIKVSTAPIVVGGVSRDHRSHSLLRSSTSSNKPPSADPLLSISSGRR